MKEKNRLGRQISLYSLHTDLDSDKSKEIPKETIQGLQSFFSSLKNIHRRLLREGYAIIDGKLYSPKRELLYETKRDKNR